MGEEREGDLCKWLEGKEMKISKNCYRCLGVSTAGLVERWERNRDAMTIALRGPSGVGR